MADQGSASSGRYNVLPHITEQTELQKTIPEKISDLLRIIDRHAMSDNFRIHSLHRHTKLPANTIRLETDAGKTGYTWANAMSIDCVDLCRVHPTFFKVHEGSWVAFEFAEGPLPTAPKAITKDLLNQVAVHMVDNRLGDVLAQMARSATGKVFTDVCESGHWLFYDGVCGLCAGGSLRVGLMMANYLLPPDRIRTPLLEISKVSSLSSIVMRLNLAVKVSGWSKSTALNWRSSCCR